MTFCDPTAETGVGFRTDGRMDGGRTDRRGSRNSYLDIAYETILSVCSFVKKKACSFAKLPEKVASALRSYCYQE